MALEDLARTKVAKFKERADELAKQGSFPLPWSPWEITKQKWRHMKGSRGLTHGSR